MQWITTAGEAPHGDVKMNTVYVLMEEGWDYNDEVYFRSDAGGGHPKGFFLNEEEANKECQARNLKSFKELWANGDIREYCYGIDELLPYNDRKDKSQKKLLEQTCQKLFGMDWDELDEAFMNQDEIPKSESGTDADWQQLFDLMTLNFWNVVTVEKV
jgi:hypothetical protein